MKCSLISAAVSASSYDSWSITWHQWHHTAPTSSSTGLSSASARSKASGPHGSHCTGWCIAERRYEEDEEESAFATISDIQSSVLCAQRNEAESVLSASFGLSFVKLTSVGSRLETAATA